MDKVLQTILKLKEKPDADWIPKLETIGIFEDVSPLYEAFSPYIANVLLAVIVLFYHRESEHLEPHADVTENKMKILRSVAGSKATEDETFLEVIHDGNSLAFEVVTEWMIDYQKDKRWKEIWTCWLYADNIFKMARKSDHADPKIAKDIGLCLEVAFQHQARGNKMFKELQEEYMALDTVLEKDRRKKITDRVGALPTWEQALINKRAKK